MKRSSLVVGLGLVFLIGTMVFAGPVEDQISKAKGLYDQGKFQEASDAFKAILSEQKEILKANNSLSAEVWQGFGESLLRAGKKDEAARAFSRVSAHKGRKYEPPPAGAKPKTPVPTTPVTGGEDLASSKNQEVKDLYKSATAQLAQGGSRSIALLELLDAWRKEPENPEILSKTALLILDSSDTYLQNAQTMLAKLKEIKKGKLTDEEKIGYAKTLFLLAPYKFDEAGKALDEVLKTNPQNVPALVAQGELFLASGKFDKALETFEKVKKSSPANSHAFWGIGYAFHGLGKEQEAMVAFQDAFFLNSHSAESNAKMGKAMFTMNKPTFANTYYRQALEIDPDNVDASLGLIPLLIDDAEDLTAIQYLKRVSELDPGNPKVFLYQGMFFEMRADFAQAVSNYELSAAYGADSIEAKVRVSKIYMGIGTPYPGKLNNEDPFIKKNLNLFYNPERAYTLLKEVMEVAPKHPDIGWMTEVTDKIDIARRSRLAK